MIYRRGYSLKVLFLCFLTMSGLLAISPQAQAGAEWEIKGKLLSSFPWESEGITGGLEFGIENNELLVPGLGLTIRCPAGDITEGQITSWGEGSAEIYFYNCWVLGSAAVCKVLPITAEVRVKLILHGNEIFALLKREIARSNLATIEIDNTTPEEPECNVATEGERQEITGTILTLISTSLAVKQLITPYSSQSLLGDELKYGNQSATLDGAMDVSLIGSYGGSNWAAEHKTL